MYRTLNLFDIYLHQLFFLLQLSMQLVALGSQSPGIWQSQLAAAAVRQMSNSAPGGQNLYPQNELQVTISNIPFYTSFVHQVGMSICSVTTKYNSITAQYLRLAICNIFQYILTKFSTSNDQFRWIWISCFSRSKHC